jgi:uncharacterized protein YjbI with pentapeptide repeats
VKLKKPQPQLQLPLYSPEGYRVNLAHGEVVLSPGGTYRQLVFKNVDFTSITVKANFESSTFLNCKFHMTDMSGSVLESVRFEGCQIRESAFMWTKSRSLTFSNTVVTNVRFAFSDLSHAKFVSTELSECNFRDTRLENALFDVATVTDCGFPNVMAKNIIIRLSSLTRVTLKESNFFGLEIRDSAVDYLAIMDSDVQASTWNNVTSEAGKWDIWGVNFTASKWSLCEAQNSSWYKNKWKDVLWERCNFFRNSFIGDNFENCTLISVGLNESKFKQIRALNLRASALRLRFGDFSDCFFKNSVIEDSAFEYAKLALSSENFQIIRPTFSNETQWYEGYSPDTQPHSTGHPKNN